MEAVFAWPGPTSDDRLQEPRFCGRFARPLSVRAAVSKTEDPTAANWGLRLARVALGRSVPLRSLRRVIYGLHGPDVTVATGVTYFQFFTAVSKIDSKG